MSSRAMKKLLRDQDGPSLKDLDLNTKTPKLENEEHEDMEDESEEEEEFVSKRPPARNLFALLDDEDQDEDAGSDDEPAEPEIITPVSTSSKKKKNKKKKSGSTAASANPFGALKENSGDTVADNDDTSAAGTVGDQDLSASKSKSKNKKKKKGKAVVKSVEEMSVEEFEKSLQQMNKQLGSVEDAGTSQQSALTPLKQLLSVDTRFLDADAEMKKMFGARVVNSEIKDRRYVKAVKKLLLAQPRNTWQIRRASGLSMDIVESNEKEGTTTFKIVHSEFYQKTQLKFLSAVASYDPNNLVMLLRDSPFHIDSLLQLSEVSKHNGDNSLAGEFIEQALYAFEKSFHSLFNIASGTVRLSFMEVENRSFFLTIHRHIQFLGRRGCWRTAFEFNKLLLSLDPKHDELGSLFSIDFYALKAQEYTYLIKLYERLNQDHGLDRLPNFAYSTALAQFHLETQRGDSTHVESSKALQRAILMFPTAVPLLADQGSYSVDSEIAGVAAFYPANDLPKTLDLYIHLLVSRNFALWKEPEVIAWLKSNLQVCAQSRFNNNNDAELKEAKALFEEFKSNESSKISTPSYSSDGTLESDEFAGSSSQSLHGVTLRVCRHVLISEYTSLARYLPQHIVRSTMHMHDPLPPPGSRNIYEERFAAQRASSGLMGGARDAAQGVLQEFVRRLTGEAQGEGGEIQEDQLRRIADAVQRLRIQVQPGHGGALPGAFPGQEIGAETESTDDVIPAGDVAEGEGGEGSAAETGVVEVPATDNADNASMLQPLTEMLRQVFGRGQAAGGNAPNLQLTQEEANALMTALGGQGGYDSESDEDEDYTDEVPPFGPEGDDGWEPYDPEAFE